MRKAFTSLSLFLISTRVALAEVAPLPGGSSAGTGSALTLQSILTIISSIINTLWSVAELAVVGGLAYAGFLMVTARGEEKQFKKGKDMLWQVVIGAAVIFGIGLILNTIAGAARNPVGVFN